MNCTMRFTDIVFIGYIENAAFVGPVPGRQDGMVLQHILVETAAPSRRRVKSV